MNGLNVQPRSMVGSEVYIQIEVERMSFTTIVKCSMCIACCRIAFLIIEIKEIKNLSKTDAQFTEVLNFIKLIFHLVASRGHFE